MKFRTDFVTNSSSSSFVVTIITRKKELTERKEAELKKYFLAKGYGGEENMKRFLKWSGDEILGDEEITMENLDEYCRDKYAVEHNQALIRDELARGKAVYHGIVVF